MLDPKYNPMCKEYHEEANRLGLTGYQYAQKLIKEGKIPDPSDLHREQRNKTVKNAGFDTHTEYQIFLAKKKGFKDITEYQDFLAKERGYKDIQEYNRKTCWNRGDSCPMSENEDCPSYLGIHIAERMIARKILPIIFGGIEKEMPPNYPGYDFIVTGGYKVNVKSRMLIDGKWYFMIRHNDIADYFLLIAFNYFQDEKDLKVLHAWLFDKNDKIRKSGGTTYQLVEFYRRHGFGVTNDEKYLSKLRKYEINDICIILGD